MNPQLPYIFQHNKDITSLTTFGIPAKAKLFAEYSSVKELKAIYRSEEFSNNEVLHIGGGSNLLFVNDFDGIVLHSSMKGIVRYDKDDETAYAIASAGEKWTDFVEWCLKEELQGVENLAGIPGEVGASAVQNVGAYGVEAKDVIHNVECFDTLTGESVIFTNEQCRFAYRDSMFKHEGKGRYYVLRVSYKLRKSTIAGNLEYGPLKSFAQNLGHTPSIRETAEEITRIRNSKLPDPVETGSAGSFFKNPIVSTYFYKQEMLGRNPDIPCYKVDEHRVKIPAGWLIEHAGLKGYKIGGAQVYPKQCLVIANAGGATAGDVTGLSQHIINTVREKYAVVLHPEVNFIDTSIEITILGSGTSKGVPEVACACSVCRSESPFDKRQRASALVKTHGLNLLIDASPDFRAQALNQNLYQIDAVLVTHSHYDHVGGIDDLRPFCADGALPIYVKEDVYNDLGKHLDYCFRDHLYPGVPALDRIIINDSPFYINGLKVTPINVMHGKLPIFGYRIGDFAYITDAKEIPEEEMEKLKGLKVLVINALREREHFAHLCIREALEIIDRLKPQEAYLTHFNHEIGLHNEFENRLPPHVHPCYDGLTIRIN